MHFGYGGLGYNWSMLRAMKMLLQMILILVMTLTSQAAALARGQTQIAGQIVLCTGQEVVMVSVDHQGQPIERMHYCPDMALSLLHAVAVDAGHPARLAIARDVAFEFPTQIGRDRPVPQKLARGPPMVPAVFAI